MATKTERGWAGHFICCHQCRFRRNTLLEYMKTRVVVSTVGNLYIDDKPEDIGFNRYYETMAFMAMREGEYWEADIERQLSFDSEWAIDEEALEREGDHIDNFANEMHERVVAEINEKMSSGVIKEE